MLRKFTFALVFVLFIVGSAKADCPHFIREKLTDPDLTVYRPSQIEEDREYPVLYLFHGRWQQPEIWQEIGLDEQLCSLYESNSIEPMFVVLPHDIKYLEDMYEDSFYEEFLNIDMPYIEEHYPISKDPHLTALGGLSRGAQWVQYIGFMNYGRFAHLGILSPPNPFFSFPKIYRIIQDHSDVEPLRVRIDIGNQDNAMRIGQSFSDQLTELFYCHEFHLSPGGHDVDFWQSKIEEYLRWFDQGFRTM